MAGDRVLRALNALYYRDAGGESRPPFFDIDATYPSLRVLDQNLAVIQAEVEALLSERQAIPRYHEVSAQETYISGTVKPEKAWRVLMLRWMAGGGLEANIAKCPRTSALLDRIPGVTQAFVSILDGGKPIPAHDGPYLGYLRYHLALKVPAEKPPSIRIKDQVHTWQVGKSILFDDSWNHEVMNESNDIRVVLIVDVMRPMSFPANAVNWFVARVLSPLDPSSRAARKNLANFQPH